MIQNWAVSAQLLEKTLAYEVQWRDEELDERLCSLFLDQKAAQAEYEFRHESSEEVAIRESNALCATRDLEARIGFKVAPTLAVELASTCYVEDCTLFDGLWWTDRLAPERLSAPRGVILPSRLERWHIRSQSF